VRSLTDRTLKRLDTQGFDTTDREQLAEVAPWLRFAFGLCTSLAVLATAMASTPFLLGLAVVALVAAANPVHPFDLIYNHGIRRITGTRPLPKRGAPARFACGIATVWLVAMVVAFEGGHPVVGYGLGLALAGVGGLVATIDVCIPSMIYRWVFGPPAPRVVVRVVNR
jgi:hypothetical protein